MYIVKDKNLYKIKNCIKFKDRLFGFMFNKKIDKILCFPRCNSVHTFFMFENIDVFMCDKDFNIKYIYRNVKPFRIILPKKNIKYIIETKTNQFSYKANDKIIIKKAI